MKIFVPLTGKTYKYYLETGSLVTHMAFYDDGIIGLQVFPDGVKVEGFIMITPDESGWIYLPRKRFSQNKRYPRVFSEDEWSKRKLISREQMRIYGDTETVFKQFSNYIVFEETTTTEE